jgi:hypothetical protein
MDWLVNEVTCCQWDGQSSMCSSVKWTGRSMK